MKSTNEIAEILLEELQDKINKINLKDTIYYNEFLGDTSFLLAGLLYSLIKEDSNIDNTIWIDDSLITKVNRFDNIILIEGIMIWGKDNTTEQWVDPFKFNMNFNNNFIDFTFLFKDLDLNEISYESFRNNRNYFSDEIENWKYRFNYKDELNHRNNE
ncbi:hypothetical protein [Chryseobacterium sp. JUb7]|uniref:hypothetical protein n=1 Tax=Chryseobacterium sp. JUb7 TaxID=2940599 RepID=UPI0021672FC1|nr:hypothetical protein [Chryseobacterium sp. JUb7]MCS3533014.1 hypothetical protein [Chryseobacterium sp. JUb7]